MNRSFRSIFLVMLMVALLFVFAGCGEEEIKTEDALRIQTIKILPKAYINESFDLRDILIPEDGVNYSATARYTDVVLDSDNHVYTVQEHELEVADLCFTPKHACDLSFLHCRSVLGGREHIFSLTKWLTIVIFVS